MNIPKELRYTSSHEWARLEDDGTITFGITEHAQDALGELVYVEMPAVGDEFTSGDECGVVESTKAASDIYAPFDGEIVEINEALEDNPALMNESPYEEGWFARVKPAVDASEVLESMMSAEAYEESLHG